MMNIEGTPNEKALIVIFSYIIGFVSAFIIFNFAIPGVDTSELPKAQLPNQSATVVSSQENIEQDKRETEAVYENDGLYLYTKRQPDPILLSKNIQSVNVDYSQLTTIYDKQGFHSEIPVYNYLSNQGYVYYCEVYDVVSECTPYLYDVNRNTLHVVLDDNGPVSVSVSNAREATINGVIGLSIGEYKSISLNRIWEVGVQ